MTVCLACVQIGWHRWPSPVPIATAFLDALPVMRWRTVRMWERCGDPLAEVDAMSGVRAVESGADRRDAARGG